MTRDTTEVVHLEKNSKIDRVLAWVTPAVSQTNFIDLSDQCLNEFTDNFLSRNFLQIVIAPGSVFTEMRSNQTSIFT